MFLACLMCLSLTQTHVSIADLVDDTCKQTPNKDLCESTLRADPRSSTADVAGLAIIVVDTIKGKATDTVAQINTLLGSNPDPKTKNGLDSCLKKYSNAILNGDIPSALEGLQKNNPKFAEQGMNDAANEANSCEGSFAGASPISSFNKTVTDLSNVASAIIKLLL